MLVGLPTESLGRHTGNIVLQITSGAFTPPPPPESGGRIFPSVIVGVGTNGHIKSRVRKSKSPASNLGV